MPLDYHKSASAMIAATIGRSVSSDVYCLFEYASQKGLLHRRLRTAFKREKKKREEEKGRREKKGRKSGEYVRVAQTVTASITKVTPRSVFLNRRAR